MAKLLPRPTGRLVLLGALMVLAGCNSGPEDPASPPPKASASPATETAPSPAESPVVLPEVFSPIPTAGAGLESDGYYFGFIRSVENRDAPSKIEFDVAELLTGQPAIDAKVADGQITSPEEAPNDFYIRNQSKNTRSIVVKPDAKIVLIKCVNECLEVPVVWTDMTRLLYGPEWEDEVGFYGGPEAPFKVRLEGGDAVSITSQYTP